MRKRGFGLAKYNGFGGKIEPGETVEEAAVRELQEEIGVKVSVEDMEKAAELTFIFPSKQTWSQLVHVFFIKKWEGTPIESEEMTAPEWFDINKIPFDRMWQDDRHWLPLVLQGKKVEATFTFEDNAESIADFEVKTKHNF